MPTYRRHVLRQLGGLALTMSAASQVHATSATLAYLVSDVRIPFWDILRRGVETQATGLGYRVLTYSAENDARKELDLAAQAIRERVDGIVISPTQSAAAVTVLRMARTARIPVVIADIGADEGEYVSYIASDNRTGSYQIGKVLVQALQARQWHNGSVGIIAIPQKRVNGQARTAGFMQALEEAGIRGAGLRQQLNFSYQETYDFARELIATAPNLRALWLQGSDRYQAALDAIAAAGRQNQVFLVCFDAEPAFLDLIPRGILVGAAMQQPFLMGEKAVEALHLHRLGRSVERHQQLPILAVSAETLKQQLPLIRRNVLGLEHR